MQHIVDIGFLCMFDKHIINKISNLVQGVS